MPEIAQAGEFTLVRDFAIIMAVAGVAIILFRRIKQPPVLGYVIAGLIVGPFTLPLLGIQSPVSNVESIRLLADLGLVLLLFALGLDFGWHRIRQMGLRVILIGTIEIIFMIALGYEIAMLLGWSTTEAIFLGGALSISSSAIIVKVLRDRGLLMTSHGKLIVGILLVEDFAAVLLLSVLSGVAITGTASMGDVFSLVGKLTVFFVSAIFLGALLAPRLINFVARFQSRETLLIVSLALCFGLGLVAERLGISAAAGAFIIGTVLGDSEHSEELKQTMAPVRDIFAALFFVSIGMLIDVGLIGDYVWPALIISGVFLVGKIVADTIGTFIAGHDGTTSLNVGVGMPQMGEFSLAMTKVGADYGAIGAFLYPIIAVATAITSFVYPLVSRSGQSLAGFLSQNSPSLAHEYVDNLSRSLITMRAAFTLQGQVASDIRRSGRVIMVNFGVIIVLIGIGTFALTFATELAAMFQLQEIMLGLVIGGGVVLLCMPPAVFIWRSLQRLTDELSAAIIRRDIVSISLWGRADLHDVLRDSILVAMAVLLAIWSLPFISQLVIMGSFSAPIPIMLLVGLVALLWRVAFKIHNRLVNAFSKTFLGDPDNQPIRTPEPKPVVPESPLFEQNFRHYRNPR
ncbi:MAG: cation:proton antiporter [Chloroflexi bacterium]|nr:cation:proton antiporter [Chloroflexota bacterium]